MLVIRPTDVEDAPQVTACIDAVARERHFLAATHGFSTGQTRSFIEFLRKSRGVHLVVLDGGRVVGWCDVTPCSYEGMTHVGRLGRGLLPTFRGHGWGRRLLATALDAAFANNLGRIELAVFAANTGAITLYRRAGFREEGRKRLARRLDGVSDDIIVFGLLHEEWPGIR